MILRHALKIGKPLCEQDDGIIWKKHNVYVKDYLIGILVSTKCTGGTQEYDFSPNDPDYYALAQLIWCIVENRWFVDNRTVTGGDYEFSVDITPNTQHTSGEVFGIITISSILEDEAWEGWATSTYFGDGEKQWPSGVPNAENLDDINNPDALTFGAAIPWRYYCKEYGSRSQLLVAYQNNWIKNGNDLFCFDVQPIIVTPDKLKQGSYDEPPGNGTMDINGDAVVALKDNHMPYPVYQVVPYEGCGGDCASTSCPDCFNSCIGGEQSETLDILNCDFSKTTTECCSAMRTLYDDGKWENTKQVHDQFTASNSQPTAINYDTLQWNNEAQRVNWCSGFSLHFDFAYPMAPWANLIPDPKNGPNCRTAGDYNNVMLRYRRRKCNNWKT